MDPKLVAIIEDYARTHGLNLPPHQIVSDMVATGPSGIEQLLAMLGMSINAGDPADNTAAQAGQAGREAQLDDALTKFPATEEESAAQLAGVGGQEPLSEFGGLTQMASGMGQGLAGALSGVMQPFSQLPQAAQQALQTGLGAVQQAAGSGAEAAEALPEELLGDGLGGVGEAAGGAGAGLGGTIPASTLGPPPTPSAGTVPASSPTRLPPPPAPPPPAAPGGGMAGMPMMPPGAVGGGSATDAKTDTKRIVGPSVKNGSPVQGRVTPPPVVPEVVKRVRGNPVPARRMLDLDHKPDDDADPER
jgi:hypothetical protein